MASRSKKRRYRLLTNLSWPPPDIVRRLQAGEPIPLNQRQMTEYAAGDIRDDVPATSVPWLLEQGAIEEVTDTG